MAEAIEQPSGALGKIVAATRRRITARRAVTSLEALLARAEPSRRSLEAALRRPGARFILEMKRRSPSRGELRREATAAGVAAAYRGLADAVSVLTEPEFFGGSLEDLAGMRQAVEVPLLQKDFVLDPWQVAEARLHGADAVLLMLSVLDDATARDCLEMCRRLSMEALVEVHATEELERALDLDAEMIGINNRDLATLEVDLESTERLARRVPAARLLVAESGIGSRHDVARLAPRVDALLIGSALMTESDLRGAAADLTLGRFKVCGLTGVEDASAARDAGAWRLGTVFADDSPRRCDPELARRIGAETVSAETGAQIVAVFRNQSIDEMIHLARGCGAAALQPHQTLTADDLERLRRRLPGVEIWQVHAVDAGSRPRRLPRPDGDRLFVDSAADGRSGGTGRPFDLDAVATDPGWSEVIVAGGITPRRAPGVFATGPYAIDLSSSLEAAPGVKSRRALEELRRALRPPDRGTTRENRA